LYYKLYEDARLDYDYDFGCVII